MPEMTGIELYDAMRQAGSTLPVIFLTGHGAIPESVMAMKRGAVNFLTKPAKRDDLLAAVREALVLLETTHQEDFVSQELRRRFASLTPREEEVCLKVVQGLLNKQIADDLGASEKTIKVHRGRVMEKMQVGSVAELVRIVDRIHKTPTNKQLAAKLGA
jgi:FixJ family two-component response regulator